MKINLLRCLVAMGDNELSVSAAARELRMLQPSVSKNLMDLEKDAGAIFVRRGRRFVGMTPLGRELLAEARDILLKCDNIDALKRRHGKDAGGDIRIGTTHLQARYVLPDAVREYLRQYPRANIQIQQNTPANLVQMLEHNLVDVVICTEALEDHPRLDSAEAYRWNRAVIAPRGHPLAGKTLTLKKIAEYPIITYVRGFTGRAAFDAVFRRARLQFNVPIAAADSDVIKCYVRAGVGIGVVAAVSYDPREDRDLECISAARLFPDMRVRMAYLRDKLVTPAMRRFMRIFRRRTAAMRGVLGAKSSRRAA